jgi:hypothetical protein
MGIASDLGKGLIVMDLESILHRVLQEPTPEALWELQGALRVRSADGSEDEARASSHALEAAGQFYLYLSELQSKTTAREFSELASLLDIGAVGLVAVESLVTEGEKLWEKVLLGGMGESLMVLASRQYIKAWAQETELVHRRAAWYLFGALWRLSVECQPDLGAEQRQALIQALLAPSLEAETPVSAKIALLGRLFQVLLLTYVLRAGL